MESMIKLDGATLLFPTSFGYFDKPSDDLKTLRGIARALNAHFHIAAFQFKLGDVFLDQEINEFFELFLIHVCAKTIPVLSHSESEN